MSEMDTRMAEEIFGVKPNDALVKETVPAQVTPEAAPSFVSSQSDGMDGATPTTTPMSSLANFVMARFQENVNFRDGSGVSERLDFCIRAQKCEFDAKAVDTMARLGLSRRLFVPIISMKNRAAKSMLIDLANQSGEPLFHLEASPSPEVPESVTAETARGIADDVTRLFQQLEQSGVTELPPEAMRNLTALVRNLTDERYDDIKNKVEDYARVRAKRMEKKVWDVMSEGGWNKAFHDVIANVCTYGTAVMIGPVVRNVAKNKCVEKLDAQGIVVSRVYRRVVERIPVFEAVNPQDCYPAPDAKNVDDGAFCVRVKYTANRLWQFANGAASDRTSGDGWMRRTVQSILARHPRGGVKLTIGTYSPDRRTCENNGNTDINDCTFEGVRCFASVRGSELAEMGIVRTLKGKRIDLSAFYKTETIVIDNCVVYCRIYPDEMETPVSKCVFYELPGSWWGESIADKVGMCQTVLNNCVRALMQNMSAASGPVFWINDVQRMANKSPDAYKFKAGTTIPFAGPTPGVTGNTGAPIGALTVPSNASELLAVWKQMQTQADLDSGIPAYTEGQSAGQSGALRTAAGLSIFTEASNRGMKMVMTTIDNDLISRTARMTADWVLLNDDDMDLKGDVSVRSVGLIGKIMKAQRDNARLQLFQMVLNSQTLTQLIGVKGIVEMFRPCLVDIDVNPDDILPSKGKMEEMEIINGIKQIFEATQASQGVQQNAGMAPADGADVGGTRSGASVQPVETPQVEMPRGGVAERRGVA